MDDAALRAPPSDGRLAAPLLEEVFGGAARRLRARLATRTGSDSPVRVSVTQVATLGELCAGDVYADGALWCAFSFAGIEVPAVAVVEGRLLARLMGRLFGEGDVDVKEPRARSGLTEVERAIGARMCRELLDALSECWAGSEPLVARTGEIAPSRRVCSDVDAATPMAITTVEFGGLPTHGNIFVALPIAVLDRLLPHRTPAPPPPPPPRPVTRLPHFDRVLPVQVEVTVELGRFELSLARLQALRLGDELPLGALGEASARVGDRIALFGEPGTSGNLRSFRVGRRVDSPSSPVRGDR